MCIVLSTSTTNVSAVDWLLSRPGLIDPLKSALLGNYHIVSELTSVLENGNIVKRILDHMIDQCIQKL